MIRLFILLFVFLIVIAGCRPRTDATTLTLKKIGWTVYISKGFRVSDTMENSPLWDKMETSKHDSSRVYYSHNTLFNLEKNKANSIVATLPPFDTEAGESWDIYIRRKNKDFCQMLTSTGVTIDSVSGNETIANLPFHKFDMTVRVMNTTVFQSTNYSRQFNDHSLNIAIIYKDKKIGDQLLEIIRKSRFASQ